MPFFQGPTTRLRGDPGFFGTLGKLAGGAVGIFEKATGIDVPFVGPTPQQQFPGIVQQQPQQRTRVGLPIPGTPPIVDIQRGMPQKGPCPPGPNGECPKGMRLNKSAYFLKDGTFVAPKSRCVTIRRRNFANSKALRRSLSRVEGFTRLVKRTKKSIRKIKKI